MAIIVEEKAVKEVETPKIDLWAGRKVGRLAVLRPVKEGEYECFCDCGNLVSVSSKVLSGRGKRNCGCLKKESDKISAEEKSKIKKHDYPNILYEYVFSEKTYEEIAVPYGISRERVRQVLSILGDTEEIKKLKDGVKKVLSEEKEEISVERARELRINRGIAMFWSFVEVKGLDDCWEWKGEVQRGYGRFSLRVDGFQYRYPNMLVWKITNGEIPDKERVLNTCGNKLCCNPNHLFVGRGQKYKLTNSQVDEVAERWAEKSKDLAVEYGVDENLIRRIWSDRGVKPIAHGNGKRHSSETKFQVILDWHNGISTRRSAESLGIPRLSAYEIIRKYKDRDGQLMKMLGIEIPMLSGEENGRNCVRKKRKQAVG